MSRDFVSASSQFLVRNSFLVMPPATLTRTINMWGRTASASGTLAMYIKNTGPGADGSMKMYLSSGKVTYDREDGVALMTVQTTASISANTHFMATVVTHAVDDHRVLLNGANRGISSNTISGRSYNKCFIASASEAGSDFFNGQLSEVAVWGEALSDHEIEMMYESRSQALLVRPNALVMYMSMLGDEDYAEHGTLIGGGAGTRLDFTASGSPTVSPEHPPIVRQAGGLF